MVMANFTVVLDYLTNPDDIVRQFNLMTEGLAAIVDRVDRMTDDEIFSAEKAPDDPLLKQLFLHAIVLKTLRSTRGNSYKVETLSRLMNLLRPNATRKQVPEWNLTTIDYMEHLVTLIHKNHMERATEESVVCACAPIVPYVGVLRKPFVGQRVNPELAPADEERIAVLNSEKGWSNLELTRLWYQALKMMKDILMNHELVDHVLLHSQIFMHPDSFNEQYLRAMIDFARQSEGHHNEYNVAITYYLWAFVYKLLNDSADRGTIYKIMIRAVDFTKLSFTELFDQLIDESSASESELADTLDNYELIDKFTSSTAKAKPSPKVEVDSPEEISSFDLQALLNFIYTNRRFRSNSYSNMAFVNDANVRGYTYYKDILIIEPAGRDGQRLDYIYAPVVDDLMGSKVVIIKFWRDGHIDLLSQNDYSAERHQTGSSSI